MQRTPGGASTRSKQHQVFGGGAFPKTSHLSELASVWGEDGVTIYTDWICALGAVGLGHQGWGCFYAAQSLPSPQEEIAAEKLLGVLPQHTGWDQVRWVTTGSECTAAAMQVARMQTRRKKVVSVGYHGWHEAHLASENLVALPIDSPMAEWEIDGDTAACIVEPMRDTYATRTYLELSGNRDAGVVWEASRQTYLAMLAKMCKDTGALFIVDEIVTGFRYALGGATERYGLEPDLACYGKAMSNGFPIAALVGGQRLMKHAVEVSGTYNGWPPALDAVMNTVQVYKEKDVVGHMRRLGERLLAGTQGILQGWPCHPVFAPGIDRVAHVQKAARGGHLLHPAGFNIMLAHTEGDVDRLIEVLRN